MITFKRLFFLIIILSSISFAQFTSVQSGKWYWPSTWSNDPNATAIPDSNDNVTIYHDVNLETTGRCKNLTVESGGRVHNGYLVIHGSLNNNGTINGLAEFYGMYISLRGDLLNSGKFESEVYFTGTSDQTIFSSDSLKLSFGYDHHPGSRVIFENSIVLYDSFLFLNGAELFLNDNLTLANSGIDGGLINGNNQTIFGNNGEIGWGHAVGFGPQKTIVKNVVLEGTMGLYGGVREDDIWTTVFSDNVINNGIIYNQYFNSGGGASIFIDSDFINNGTIQQQQDGLDLFFRGQNFTNNGTFISGTLSLVGTVNQNVNIPNVSNFTPTSLKLYSDVEGNSYQWEKDGVNILYATISIFTLDNFDAEDQGTYRCLVDGNTYSRNINIGQSSSPQQVTLLEQHFDSENEAADWTKQSQNGSNTWMLGNIQDANFNQIDPTSVKSAICPYDANNDQDEYLISPTFSLGAGSAELNYYVGYNSAWASNALLKVLISLDDGQSWSSIWTYNLSTNNWEWSFVNLDLTNYSNNQFVKLAFEYVGRDGDFIALDNVKIIGYEFVTDILEEESVLNSFALSQNYPNPFNPSTQINYSIPSNGKVELLVYDMLGRIVGVLVDEIKNAGSYSVYFNAGELSSGVYFYRLSAGQYSETKKLLLLR